MADGQMSLVDALLDARLGSNAKLEAIDRLIDWRPLAREAHRLRTGATGRPPYEPLAMLKALYLAALYGLSDPALEEALLDRISFRLFCGFGLDKPTPDETTLCRFRHDAARAGVLERCFALIGKQLEAKGLVVKKGTLMDATLIAAKHNPPPASAGLAARHECEPEANWTKKNGKAFFGYNRQGQGGYDAGQVIPDILRQLAILEDAGLYHNDV